MSLMRKSSMNQLKRIRKIVNQSGGDIGDKTNTKAEMKMPNSLWIDNPADRDIDTIDQHIKLEVESFSEYKKLTKEEHTYTSMEEFKKMLNEEFDKDEMLNEDNKAILLSMKSDIEYLKEKMDKLTDTVVKLSKATNDNFKELKSRISKTESDLKSLEMTGK